MSSTELNQNATEQYQLLLAAIARHRNDRGALIPILHEAQEIFGYLPLEVQRTISEELSIPLAEIFGVVSMGTACYVKGSGDILDKFKERLSIDIGECTEDGRYSLDACRCIGACGLAPVVTVNDEVFGKLNADDVDGIIDRFEKLEDIK